MVRLQRRVWTDPASSNNNSNRSTNNLSNEPHMPSSNCCNIAVWLRQSDMALTFASLPSVPLSRFTQVCLPLASQIERNVC